MPPIADCRNRRGSNNLAGTANDLTQTFAYNPASQIVSVTRSNDAYAWTGHSNENITGVANGLNQLTSVGGTAATYDARGNLTTDPGNGNTYAYSSENLLGDVTTAAGGIGFIYDALGRVWQMAGGPITDFRFVHDPASGIDEPVAEYRVTDGAVLRRYVFGPGIDEPIVQYEGAGATDRRFLSADERGSIVALSDSAGAPLGINKYDEFGQPQASNLGRFQYTGQAWLPQVGLYYYKARMYQPALGRFVQTDPAGYEDSPNLYAYVLNDPVTLVDPLGMQTLAPGYSWCGSGCSLTRGEVVITGGDPDFGTPMTGGRNTQVNGGSALILRGSHAVRQPARGESRGPLARLGESVLNATCHTIDEGGLPTELLTTVAGAVATSLVESLVSRGTSEAMRQNYIRRSAIGATPMEGAVRNAVRGRRAGLIGAAAGFAAGYFFDEQIDRAIQRATSFCNNTTSR